MTGPIALIALLFCLQGAAKPATPDPAADATTADVKLLREQMIGTDGPALLAYLRQHTATPDDLKHIADLVRQLGDEGFQARQAASMELRRFGKPALPALREAARDPDLEVARRAQECIDAIESGSGAALPIAVCRRLSRLAPAGAAEVLLGYIPFADDALVEDEVCAALLTLTPRGRPGPAIQAALSDSVAGRRAAAAFVAGRADDMDIRSRVAKLLADRDALVRFRAAEGLLGAGDRRAVEAFAALLADGPMPLAWRAEMVLLRLVGDQTLDASIGTGSAEDRKKWRDGWLGWWRANGAKIDLARASQERPYLRQILVPQAEPPGDLHVIEFGGDNKPLWDMKLPHRATDVRLLPGGRVLVCEWPSKEAGRVVEYEMSTGKLLWSHPISLPWSAERLANGNYLIANWQYCCEVTPAGKEVFRHSAEPGFHIQCVSRRSNGNLVWLSMGGILRELTPEGKRVVQYDLSKGAGGNWCGVEALPGGRYLVAEMGGQVLEFDSQGREVWKLKVGSSSYATRLPTGNTLIANYSGNCVIEVNREGTVVREVKVTTSPWRVHAR